MLLCLDWKIKRNSVHIYVKEIVEVQIKEFIADNAGNADRADNAQNAHNLYNPDISDNKDFLYE